MLAEKQRNKLEQLERKLKELWTARSADAKDSDAQAWPVARGRGYSLHLHEVVEKLSMDGIMDIHPALGGWHLNDGL